MASLRELHFRRKRRLGIRVTVRVSQFMLKSGERQVLTGGELGSRKSGEKCSVTWKFGGD